MTRAVAVVDDAFEPACMDAGELADWRSFNGRLWGRGNKAKGPCDDCTLGYAADMRAQGRCNGEPPGVADDEETTLVDHSDVISSRRVEVAVSAPCASCLHQPVCRIAGDLATFRGLTAAVPEIDRALTVTLAASVECSHYAGSRPSAGAKRHLSPEGRAAILAANQARAERQREAKASAAG